MMPGLTLLGKSLKLNFISQSNFRIREMYHLHLLNCLVNQGCDKGQTLTDIILGHSLN
jgi:hypothetical protein